MTDSADLRERRDQALRDLVELDEQRAVGEIDQATADDLRRRYEAEAATAMRALREAETAASAAAGRAAGDGPDRAVSPGDGSSQRSWRRTASGAALAVAAVAGGAVLLSGAVTERPPGGFVTGNEASSVTATDAGGRDPATVTDEELEAVVAANPDVVPMRLRLAHRYLDAGQPDRALEHYMAVLEREPHPEALSHLGWIVFNDGEVELGAELLERSLQRGPDDPEALWFLANVRLYGQDDPAAAIPLLEELLAGDTLDDTSRADATTLLEIARRRAAGRDGEGGDG